MAKGLVNARQRRHGLKPQGPGDFRGNFELHLHLRQAHGQLLAAAPCAERVILGQADGEGHGDLVARLDDLGPADEIVEMTQGGDVLDRRAGDRKDHFFADHVVVQVDAGIGEKTEAGHVKILQVIAVPDDLERVQVVEGDFHRGFVDVSHGIDGFRIP
ncbi:hypothetical protein DESC_10042 [Desulfosarcina cetonica]|nr:hypothetical protein DESC_10042 [Desulfosarcina cetonica]